MPPKSFTVKDVNKNIVNHVLKKYGYWDEPEWGTYNEHIDKLENPAAYYNWGIGEREALMDLLINQKVSADEAFDMMNFNKDKKPTHIISIDDHKYAIFLPLYVIKSTSLKSTAGFKNKKQKRKLTKKKTKKVRKRT